MNRRQVLQTLLDRRKNPTYLEIGVERGKVLTPMRAGRKIAVDPQFRISWKTRLWGLATHHSNRSLEYYEVTSDDFFEHHSAAIQNGIDVAFVDGLHTYEQAHRDVENCLKFLKPDGVIVMHDCIPPNAAAAAYGTSPEEVATRKLPGWTGQWTGDVYKAVVQLRAERTDINVFVLDCDYGLGVIEKGTSTCSTSIDVQQMVSLKFEDYLPLQNELLNVKQPEYFHEWLSRAA